MDRFRSRASQHRGVRSPPLARAYADADDEFIQNSGGTHSRVPSPVPVPPLPESALLAATAAIFAAFGFGPLAFPLPQRGILLGRLGEPIDRRVLKALPRAARQFAGRDGRCGI